VKINQDGIDLIKFFEGFSSTPYICPGGKRTIGYGHVIPDGMDYESISEYEAEELLKVDLDEAENYVLRLVEVPLNQNQFSALVSFTYNLGYANLKTSTLLKKVNKKDYISAAQEFVRWIFAGGNKQKGLMRRRCSEALLWLK
jgi:lysozyme